MHTMRYIRLNTNEADITGETSDTAVFEELFKELKVAMPKAILELTRPDLPRYLSEVTSLAGIRMTRLGEHTRWVWFWLIHQLGLRGWEILQVESAVSGLPCHAFLRRTV